MSLFFMERSYFHIKYSLKTFHNIVHALMYAQMILIIWSLGTHWSADQHPARATLRELSRGGLI